MKNYSKLAGLNITPNMITSNNYNNNYSKPLTRNRYFDNDDSPFDPVALGHNIRRSGSHIYFYDEINPETQIILQLMLRDATRDVLTEHIGDILGGELPESVTIHLNSPGGYGTCGFALYDYIKTSQIPITCIVEGTCASAATLIMLACSVRLMSPNSSFLMHQCSWGAYGDNRYMQDLAKNAEEDMYKLRQIYMKETAVAADKEDPKEREAYIQHWLEHDFCISAQDCEKLGITNAHDEDGSDDVELSEERVAKLNDFVKKLADEQRKEDVAKAKAEEEAKKKPTATAKKQPAPSKKTTKKTK